MTDDLPTRFPNGRRVCFQGYPERATILRSTLAGVTVEFADGHQQHFSAATLQANPTAMQLLSRLVPDGRLAEPTP